MANVLAASLLEGVGALACQAGAVILPIYQSDFAVGTKNDDSPVTAADHAAEAVILAGLRRLTPDIPVVAEEEAAAGRVPDIGNDRFWLVDPLDGTREFIKRNGEFTVNIALIEEGYPVLGVVYAPAVDCFYAAVGPGSAVIRVRGETRAIQVRSPSADGVVVVASRSHGDPAQLEAFLKDYTVKALAMTGSSLKFCLVASGQADLYPRFGRTMEWDTAAGHAVLLAAGGDVRTVDGETLRYGKPGFENPCFIASGERGFPGPKGGR
ncbi:MAG: 3'(2'),5'-bisphosphate nucleotidase CysQ [Alphaproteobacteria bacterium]|nr:3'(2'),5'-bisphosphate nucleotidase CysQ [Alphaproteobacteria bacterium]